MTNRANKKKKRSKPINKAAAMQHIDEMITLTVKEVRYALEVVAALVASDAAIKSARREVSFASAHCFHNIIRRNMALILSLALARLFEGTNWTTKKKNDNWEIERRRGRAVASIPLLLWLLNQKRCRAVLARRARDWTPGMMEDDQASACESAIDRAIAVYKQLRTTREGRSALKNLERFRNKTLAHNGILPDLSQELGPTYDHLFLLMNVARDVTSAADFAICGNNLALEELEQRRRRECYDFWKPALDATAIRMS